MCTRYLSLAQLFRINRSQMRRHFNTVLHNCKWVRVCSNQASGWRKYSCGARNIMTNKIYTRMTRTGIFGSYSVFGGIRADGWWVRFSFVWLAKIFRDEKRISTFSYRFYVMLQPIAILFVLDILNRSKSKLKFIPTPGTLLLVENGKLLHVEFCLRR